MGSLKKKLAKLRVQAPLVSNEREAIQEAMRNAIRDAETRGEVRVIAPDETNAFDGQVEEVTIAGRRFPAEPRIFKRAVNPLMVLSDSRLRDG
jgi:2-phospho-L-lactate guanylyltransferase (CobY/MobA/RfbA family)